MFWPQPVYFFFVSFWDGLAHCLWHLVVGPLDPSRGALSAEIQRSPFQALQRLQQPDGTKQARHSLSEIYRAQKRIQPVVCARHLVSQSVSAPVEPSLVQHWQCHSVVPRGNGAGEQCFFHKRRCPIVFPEYPRHSDKNAPKEAGHDGNRWPPLRLFIEIPRRPAFGRAAHAGATSGQQAA